MACLLTMGVVRAGFLLALTLCACSAPNGMNALVDAGGPGTSGDAGQSPDAAGGSAGADAGGAARGVDVPDGTGRRGSRRQE